MTKYPSFSGGEKRLPCPRFALRTANSTTAVRRTLALLAPLSSLLLTACGSLTGLDAGSTFNCGKGEGVPCTSVETLSLEHAARTLPYQKEEEARASRAAFGPSRVWKRARCARRCGRPDGIPGRRERFETLRSSP